MKNSTRESEIQAIQKVLEEYLSSRSATKAALEVYQSLHQSLHHEGNIAKSEDKGRERVEKLVSGHKNTGEFETITIPCSKDPIYEEVMSYYPTNQNERIFKTYLYDAINAYVEDFEVFVCDPSLKNGKLQFVPGYPPAVGHSYNELKDLAKRNGISLGKPAEYFLFLGWFIHSLINEGRSMQWAWNAVCTDSRELGHYRNSEGAIGGFEVTGSRRIAGKCDLGNTKKVLYGEEPGNIAVAGGSYYDHSVIIPLAKGGVYWEDWDSVRNMDKRVGWFVRRKAG